MTERPGAGVSPSSAPPAPAPPAAPPATTQVPAQQPATAPDAAGPTVLPPPPETGPTGTADPATGSVELTEASSVSADAAAPTQPEQPLWPTFDEPEWQQMPSDNGGAPDKETASMATPLAEQGGEPERVDARCPACGAPVSSTESFCEACGAELVAEHLTPLDESDEREPARPASRVCAECGGRVGDDLYCEQCGTKAASERDHFTEFPAAWVAGVCDRGIRHGRNEDAMALWAGGERGGVDGRAVLVVCDGVSTATDSDLASMAAARAASKLLVESRPRGLGVASSRTAATHKTITAAVQAANDAVIKTNHSPENPPSCTFACAVVDGAEVIAANIGDSRVYWIDDEGAGRQLSVDDSVAQARIAMGVPREQAESSPQAHAITRWLGPDAPDLEPTIVTWTATTPGWVLVCSDGLWNYASTPDQLGRLIGEATTRNPDNRRPEVLSASLTKWANQQGGKDNITVALARLEPTGTPAPSDPVPPAEGPAAHDVGRPEETVGREEETPDA